MAAGGHTASRRVLMPLAFSRPLGACLCPRLELPAMPVAAAAASPLGTQASQPALSIPHPVHPTHSPEKGEAPYTGPKFAREIFGHMYIAKTAAVSPPPPPEPAPRSPQWPLGRRARGRTWASARGRVAPGGRWLAEIATGQSHITPHPPRPVCPPSPSPDYLTAAVCGVGGWW